MAIKARFVEGVTSATTKSLYQWDYGQQLEIESADLPETFEVHFACPSMKEAAVVPCSAVDGVGVVEIPNKCLEQSSTITAWVYELNGGAGSTTKTISIPVTGRLRPSYSDEIPQHIVDKYAELITLVNDMFASLKNGEVVVAKARTAENADYATSAGNASSASYATSAGAASKATTAENADHAKNADNALNANYATSAGTAEYAHTADELV